MKEQRCNICGNKLVKNGKTSSGKTRWRCLKCGSSTVVKYDKTKSDFKRFLNWLLSKKRMVDMPGQGRSFRRATNKFWNIWPLAPIVDEIHDVIYVDGLHLGRSAVILIACTDKYVLSCLAGFIIKFIHTFCPTRVNFENNLNDYFMNIEQGIL